MLCPFVRQCSLAPGRREVASSSAEQKVPREVSNAINALCRRAYCFEEKEDEVKDWLACSCIVDVMHGGHCTRAGFYNRLTNAILDVRSKNLKVPDPPTYVMRRTFSCSKGTDENRTLGKHRPSTA
jgi:hypothetical protein